MEEHNGAFDAQFDRAYREFGNAVSKALIELLQRLEAESGERYMTGHLLGLLALISNLSGTLCAELARRHTVTNTEVAKLMMMNRANALTHPIVSFGAKHQKEFMDGVVRKESELIGH